MDHLLITLSRPPYAGSLARGAIDLALAFAVFNQQPRLLFQGEGVWQLIPEQAPAGRGALRKVIDSLPLYDVEHCFVAGQDLTARQLSAEQLPEFVRVLDRPGVLALRREAATILSL